MGYNGHSGDGTDALGNPYDPRKHTLYLYPDVMDAIDAAHSYGEGINEPHEMTPWELLEPLLNATETEGSGSGKVEAKANLQFQNTMPARSPGLPANPLRPTQYDSMKPGTIYYNSHYGYNFRKNKDGSSSISVNSATDTIRY